MKINEDNLKAWMEEYATDFTDDINKACYILEDGRMISGFSKYSGGNRDIEHRDIFTLKDAERYYNGYTGTDKMPYEWKDMLNDLGLVLVMPETKNYLRPDELSFSQELILEASDFENANKEFELDR